ncbi:hypothetical protein B0H67DRAFT_515985, partial [Lasiosphaeris hirsuta]
MISIDVSQGISWVGWTTSFCLVVGAIAACLWFYPTPAAHNPAPPSPARPTSDLAQSAPRRVHLGRANLDKNEADPDIDSTTRGLHTEGPDPWTGRDSDTNDELGSQAVGTNEGPSVDARQLLPSTKSRRSDTTRPTETWTANDDTSSLAIREEAHKHVQSQKEQEQNKHLPSPNDYTVGWICAISTEYTAALCFLEEQHGTPDHVSVHDYNDYTLGRIGKHNVVIAVLPDGEYGTVSAAGVAKDMRHSFPNVRIGLMVGIGGGAPSQKHDIRLGDIVISAPRDGKGGVFQYDYGKTIQDQSFQPTGFLNQPPVALRAAVNGLKTQYERNGHQFDDTLNEILEKNPRLRMKYKRPDQGTDRLYTSTFVHPTNPEGICTAVCSDDARNLLPRRERTKDEDNPAIHCGLIASANQLMKDARIRDKLAAEMDVLCFEMEAAGLMNQFPCLVIRGICDYSDSHKNKEWQGYAALVAAAYAKDLLYRIPPNKVEAERRIGEMIFDVYGDTKTIRSKLERKDDLEILNWIITTDYGPQQSDYLNLRQPGTGQWLLESKEFNTWVTSKDQTLFCPGIPGAGKTILMSMVVDHLMTKFQAESSIGIAYIYCNFKRQEEQTAVNLLASVLKQLAQSQDSLASSVKELYDKHKINRTRPSVDELAKVLYSVVTMYSRVYIIVDALDECQTVGGCQEIFLTEMLNLQANLLVTSRPIQHIEAKFQGTLSLEIRATDEDVHTYLTSHLARLPSFVRDDSGLQKKIQDKIVQATDGMFLLAPLHIEALAQEPTVGHIELALEKLPQGADEIYDQAMARIQGQRSGSRELALKVLSFVVHAKRVLSSTELRHAVAVEAGQPKLDDKFIPSLDIISSICGGLITTDSQSDIVRLVHYTTQEYFDNSKHSLFPEAEADIAAICTTYLSFGVFKNGFCQTEHEFEERLRLNPLYDYAAQNWGHHARVASQLPQQVMTLIKCQAMVDAASQALLAERAYFRQVPRQVTGLHLVAFFGVQMAIKILAQDPKNLDRRDIEAKDEYGRTPLCYAAEQGHEAVVKLLLDKGADTEAKGRDDRTPLCYAAGEGHEAVVKLLLDKGADTEAKGRNGQTPLCYAAEQGHKAVVKLLLDKGADTEAKVGYESQTPLSYAARRGHEAVVKLLLDKGADTEAKDRDDRTPLWYATKEGHEAVVKLLLDKGADTEAKG